MAGGESNVDFGAMTRAKTQFEGASSEAHKHRTNVEQAKEYAQSVWRGESASGYFSAIDAWLTQFDVVTTNLDNLTAALGEALTGYRGKEQGNTQRSSQLTATIHAE